MLKAKAEALMTRRGVIGNAVRQLRVGLGKSQSDFAMLIGGRTTFLEVSRWERGRAAPNQWRCEKLAQIAKGAGRLDIAEAFRLPEKAWHVGTLDETLNRTLTILEIGAATLREAEAADYPFASDECFNAVLTDAAATIQAYLLKRFARTGRAPRLSDGGQVKLWLDAVAEFKLMDEYERSNGRPGYLASAEDDWVFGPENNTVNDHGGKRTNRKEKK